MDIFFFTLLVQACFNQVSTHVLAISTCQVQGLKALTIGTSGMVGTVLADRHREQVPKGQERNILYTKLIVIHYFLSFWGLYFYMNMSYNVLRFVFQWDPLIFR